MWGHRVILAVAALAAAAAILATAALAARSYSDPAGDSGGAPDLTDIQIGTDLVNGTLVFWVRLENRPSIGADDAVLFYLDTDLNGATGAPELGGTEFAFGVDDQGGVLFRWSGTAWEQVPAPTLRSRFVASEKSFRIELHPSDLGGTRGFNFFALAVAGEEVDVAPSGDGVYSYSVETGRLVLSKEATRATAARAGKTYGVAMVVGREDTNEILAQGSVTCTLRLGKATVRSVVARFVDGVATCAWQLPKTSKGKRLTATVTVRHGGAAVSHTATAVVR